MAREINTNALVKGVKWQFESIEQIEKTKDSSYGKLTKYEVFVRYKASKYDNNGYRLLVNHYEDSDSYAVFWNGDAYLG